MKNKWVLSFVILVLLLTSCNTADMDSSSRAFYNGHAYEPIYNWFIIDENSSDITVEINGKNRNAKLYPDKNERFISVELELNDVLYHNCQDILPTVSNESLIEKIEINFFTNKKKEVYVNDALFNALLDLINNYNDSLNDNSKIINTLGTVDVYFYDYPAYLNVGYIVEGAENQIAYHNNSQQDYGAISGYQIISFDLF